MAKRLTEKQKKEIKQLFIKGEQLDSLKNKFKVTKLTIVRNLKKLLGESEFNYLLNKNLTPYIVKDFQKEIIVKEESAKSKLKAEELENSINNEKNREGFLIDQPLVEITPLIEEISSDRQKDLSSIPITSMTFPKMLFMNVDKNFELEIKPLKDYFDWNFLPKDDLSRKTIEVFLDIKLAKIKCNKDQKVIKIPNTNVFKIANKILLSKGVSRIICGNDLIAL